MKKKRTAITSAGHPYSKQLHYETSVCFSNKVVPQNKLHKGSPLIISNNQITTTINNNTDNRKIIVAVTATITTRWYHGHNSKMHRTKPHVESLLINISEKFLLAAEADDFQHMQINRQQIKNLKGNHKPTKLTRPTSIKTSNHEFKQYQWTAQCDQKIQLVTLLESINPFHLHNYP